VVERTDIIL